MATMADIAKKACVSPSTVSYVLSGKRPVSEATKKRVLAAIAELEYQPHALARGLRTRHSNNIALLIPASLAKGLIETQLAFVTSAAQVASQYGYGFLLWTSPSDNQEIQRIIKQGHIDGLILMEITLDDPRVNMLRTRGYPFTMIGRCRVNDSLSFVDLDFDHAVCLCLEHLIALGHRHIAFINYSSALYEAGYGPAVRFLEGFQRAARDRRLTGLARFCETTPQDGYATTRTLLEENPDLSAIFTVNERAIGGIAQAILDSGKHIPEDVSLIAVASPRLAEVATPALTAVDFPAAEQGQIATEMLIRQLTGESDQVKQVVMQSRLTIRQSTGLCTNPP